MLELKLMLIRKMAIEAMPKFRSRNTLRSRIGSSVMISRTTNAVTMQTASTLKVTMNVESNQSWRSPTSSTSCRQPKPVIISTMPRTSTRRGLRWKDASKRNALIMKKATTPIGRLM